MLNSMGLVTSYSLTVNDSFVKHALQTLLSSNMRKKKDMHHSRSTLSPLCRLCVPNLHGRLVGVPETRKPKPVRGVMG